MSTPVHVPAQARANASPTPQTGALSRATREHETAASVPSSVQNAIRSGGQPLDAGTRETMGARFGHDFSKVRVYSNSSVAESARELNAKAYTVGHNIVFAPGQYAPHNGAGERLLTHELTHVVQQNQGVAGSYGQFERDAELAEKGLMPSIGIYSTPTARLQLSPNQATRLVIVLTDEGAQFTVETDTGESLTGTGSSRGLIPGIYQVSYSRRSGLLDFKAADGSNLALGRSFRIEFPPHGERMLHLLQTLDRSIPMEVLSDQAEKGKVESGQTIHKGEGATSPRQAIDELPEHVRHVLFNERATRQLQPSDYPTLLRIGHKLMELSDSELESYRARTVSTTIDLAIFEASVDRYIEEVRERRGAVRKRERTKLQLFGMDEVYQQYRRYKSMLSSSTQLAPMTAGSLGTSIGMQPTLNRMQEELTANLHHYGFNSISEFDHSIQEFVAAFRTETVLIARDMLSRYEHVLYEQEQHYQNTEETSALYRQLQPARQHFKEASRIRKEHALTPWTPEEMVDQAYWSDLFQKEQAQGRSAIAHLSGSHPLLANPDLPHEKLALAGEGDVRSVMLRYIQERRIDVERTRKNLASTPDLIFELDTLLQTAYREQNIRPGSIYQAIIEDHIRDIQIDRLMINLAIAVFAIVAGLVSGGTGTVAVLGAAGMGIASAYQAVEEFRRYEVMSAAHGAQLISDDPSFAWVIVAIVSTGIDVAALGGTVIRALRPAVQAFNETGDLVALEQQLAQLTEVEEGIRKNVVRAAYSEARTRAAWRSVFRPPAALRAVILPLAEEFGRLVYAVYLSFRCGIIAFDKFVATREAIDLIGSVARLTPEELTSLKIAFGHAIADLETIAKQGQSLGMAENEVHAFLRMWNNRRGMTVEQVAQEMEAWRATKQSGIPFGFRGAEEFKEFRSTAEAELKKLLGRSDPEAELFLQGSAVTGISYSRQVPFDVASDLDIAISSRYLMRQARTRGFEVSLSPSRIGPLTDEQTRILGLNRLRDRLSRVLTTEGGGADSQRRSNFLLFDNERSVRTPIGSASKEATRPTLPLGEQE